MRMHGYVRAAVGLDWFDQLQLLHTSNSEPIDFQ